MDMEKAVALLSVFGLGMCFSLLGSISVKLMPRLKIDQGKFGSMISAFMFACLIASLIVGVVTDKVGYKPVAIFGFVATAICIFVFANAKTYIAALVPCVLLGFGAMALNTAGNTLIPRVLYNGENPAAASNFGNVFFGLGLFLTPLIVSFLFRKTSYEKAVSALGVIVLLPVILAVMATYPQSQTAFSITNAVALLKEPAVLLAALVLFCYISLEASFCNWLPSYAKEVIKKDFAEMDESVADATSQQMLSVFAIAMMAGRLIASQMATITTNGSWYIAGAALVVGLVILAMTKTGAIWTSALVACAGFAFAPCFPTTVGVTFSKFSPEVYGSIFGIIFAVGLAGAVIVPKAIGNLAKGSTIQKSIKLLIPICAILIVVAILMGKVKGTVG
jgi:MFS transporter, FHS family, glucose/mannose:H+ symporter